MEPTERRQLTVDPVAATDRSIGRWLWALEDCRRRTLRDLEEMPPAALDWQPPGGASTIASVLYHIALVEADWLYFEVLERDIPEAILTFLPHPMRDAEGHLSQIEGLSLDALLDRLARVRSLLLDVYRPMPLDDFQRARVLEHYDVTPEWVLHHLMQHEAEHRSQIEGLIQRATAALK